MELSPSLIQLGADLKRIFPRLILYTNQSHHRVSTQARSPCRFVSGPQLLTRFLARRIFTSTVSFLRSILRPRRGPLRSWRHPILFQA
jgi:hypothetical protein